MIGGSARESEGAMTTGRRARAAAQLGVLAIVGFLALAGRPARPEGKSEFSRAVQAAADKRLHLARAEIDGIIASGIPDNEAWAILRGEDSARREVVKTCLCWSGSIGDTLLDRIAEACRADLAADKRLYETAVTLLPILSAAAMVNPRAGEALLSLAGTVGLPRSPPVWSSPFAALVCRRVDAGEFRYFGNFAEEKGLVKFRVYLDRLESLVRTGKERAAAGPLAILGRAAPFSSGAFERMLALATSGPAAASAAARRNLAEVAARLPGSEEIEPAMRSLAARIRAEGPPEAYAGVLAWRGFADEDVLDGLTSLLASEGPQVRKQAAQTVARRGGPEALARQCAAILLRAKELDWWEWNFLARIDGPGFGSAICRGEIPVASEYFVRLIVQYGIRSETVLRWLGARWKVLQSAPSWDRLEAGLALAALGEPPDGLRRCAVEYVRRPRERYEGGNLPDPPPGMGEAVRRESFLSTLKVAPGWRMPAGLASDLVGLIRRGDREEGVEAIEWARCAGEYREEFGAAASFMLDRTDLEVEDRLCLAYFGLREKILDPDDRLFALVAHDLSDASLHDRFWALRCARKVAECGLWSPALEALVVPRARDERVIDCAFALEAIPRGSPSWGDCMLTALGSPDDYIRSTAIDILACEVRHGRFAGLPELVLAACDDPFAEHVGKVAAALLDQPALTAGLLKSDACRKRAAERPRVKAVVDFLLQEPAFK
jgi:hypothetical protein